MVKTPHHPKVSPAHITAWADKKHSHHSQGMKVLHLFLRILLITLSEYKKNELSLRASALTYTILLSLVPMLAMSTAVVKGLGGGDQLRKAVYSYVETLDKTSYKKSPPPVAQEQNHSSPEIPQQSSSSLTQHLSSAIDKLFDYVDRTNFATLGTVGVIGMILSVVLVFGNIEMAMNSIWHVESGRSVMRKIADYLALLILMPISINVGFAASAVITSEKLLSKVEMILPIVWVQALILKLIPVFFLTLTLFVIYLFLPNTKVKTLPALAGALFAGIFWFEAQNIYISLQVGVAKYNAIYGSFATLPLFLIWMYFGWVFILIGAQIAFSCQNRETYILSKKPAVPALKMSAAFDIVDHVFNAFDKETPTSLGDIQATFCQYQPKLLASTTELLIDADILHITAEKEYLMPSTTLENVNHGQIIEAILGDEFSETEGGVKSSLAIKAAGKAQPQPSGK